MYIWALYIYKYILEYTLILDNNQTSNLLG